MQLCALFSLCCMWPLQVCCACWTWLLDQMALPQAPHFSSQTDAYLSGRLLQLRATGCKVSLRSQRGLRLPLGNGMQVAYAGQHLLQLGRDTPTEPALGLWVARTSCACVRTAPMDRIVGDMRTRRGYRGELRSHCRTAVAASALEATCGSVLYALKRVNTLSSAGSSLAPRPQTSNQITAPRRSARALKRVKRQEAAKQQTAKGSNWPEPQGNPHGALSLQEAKRERHVRGQSQVCCIAAGWNRGWRCSRPTRCVQSRSGQSVCTSAEAI